MSTLKRVQDALEEIKKEMGPKFTETLTGALKEQAIERINRVLDYTIHGGKFARSCLVLNTFLALKTDAKEEEIKKAARIAVVMEILQSFFLIVDDVMDNGEVRRGKPCWHRLPNIGLVAINDGLMLDQMIDLIVRETVPTHPRLYDMLRFIYETKRRSVLGELFDTTSKTLDECTFDRYEQIILHKTTYYTYILPIQLGFSLANRDDFDELLPVAERLGLLFSALDDYLDCFGDPALTGKTIMNDLVEGKCTWITCTALGLLQTPENSKTLADFEKAFGNAEKRYVNRALEILKSLKIDQLYEKYEAEERNSLKQQISTLKNKEIQPILEECVDFIINLSRKMRKTKE
ncbi:unnamed protein product [Bursaphelenchus xylophilus]|uniref:Farnesyl pyrophosphate synthase n=1 Tax=Bursaphelenchus xylophilus TaxID=6326 RepID=A0A1I7SCP4_BURXY|nr:unnamed protein product [Bursaphelenchus xylophilus]CAG9093743.1 unnamed protein product [Bursaphelenchus xylophilus]